MKSAKSLESLYNTINQISGPNEARRFLTATINNMLGELQDDGIEITEETIEAKLAETASDFLQAAKNHVA